MKYLILVILSTVANADTWPAFRGPSNNGHSKAMGVPLIWDDTKNVKWKTPIHGKGWSTPIVTETQVWLSTATEDGKEMSVVVLNRKTGEVLHDAVVFKNDKTEPLGNRVNGYASPTGLLDGERVLLNWGSYGTCAVDTKSFKVLWERRDLSCRHFRGPGSSLCDFGSLVILSMDGVDVQYLVALDKATGEAKWKTDRSTKWDDIDANGQPKADGDFRKAYATPIIISFPNGTHHLVSSGSKATFGYDPATGKELWTVTYNGFSIASSPLYADGVVYLNTGYGKSIQLAIPLSAESRGDLTSQIKWKQVKRMPLRTSPLAVNQLIFLVSDDGHASALDPKTGEPVWSERQPDLFSASPILVEGKLLFCGENGNCIWLDPSPTYKVIGQNKLPEGMLASPVAVDRELYLRTRTHLYRVEALP